MRMFSDFIYWWFHTPDGKFDWIAVIALVCGLIIGIMLR